MSDAGSTDVQSMAERFLGARWVEPAARFAVAVPFLISGVAKILDFQGSIAEVRGLTGLEPAALFAVLVILTQLGGSVLLIAGGRFAWIGALALAGFTTIATLSAHAFWLKPEAEQFLQRNIFFEHVSIVGGLVLLAILRLKPARTQD
jgi:transmembrane protein